MAYSNLAKLAAIGVAVALGASLVATPRNPGARLVIATTTSTVDTGLLDYIKPHFDAKFRADLTWLYLGTGQALAVASRGDADILLVHDRQREDEFILSGNGTHRVTLMYNDFMILGPVNDPAGVSRAQAAADAFSMIAAAGERYEANFVSRGDGSGTHALEMRIWADASLDPRGKDWYLEAGQGMASTIRIANERTAYTISDRSTWLKLSAEMGDSLRLSVVLQGDPSLINPYGLIMLNATRYPATNWQLAEKFFLFMISDEGQRLIDEFEIGGQQLFAPLFGRPESIGLPSEEQEVAYWVARLRENDMSPPPWIDLGIYAAPGGE